MEYNLIKVKFDIIDFTLKSKDIVNLKLRVLVDDDTIIFKISSYLGKGVMGQVYLLEKEEDGKNNYFPLNTYVLKISNDDCLDDLKSELVRIQKIFIKYKVVSESYPFAYGVFNNINALGVLYNFIGYYNLDKIKRINYKICMKMNISIIRQIITQLKKLNGVIHCDLKPENVVINTLDNYIKATIIDFGLIKSINDFDVISTNYITSPESLLTLKSFGIKKIKVDLSKHDYFGIFVIVINLFVKTSYWTIINKFLANDNNIDKDYLLKDDARILYGYLWFRLNYYDTEEVPNKIMRKLAETIERTCPEFSVMKFTDFDNFFYNIIVPNLDFDCIEDDYIDKMCSFLRELSYFCPEDRPSYDILLRHPFLN